jgi:hypothetical protein
VVQFYNKTSTQAATDGCPSGPFAAIDAKKLSRPLSAALTFMNPTPQAARRHWVMNQGWGSEAGETVDFDALGDSG